MHTILIQRSSHRRHLLHATGTAARRRRSCHSSFPGRTVMHTILIQRSSHHRSDHTTQRDCSLSCLARSPSSPPCSCRTADHCTRDSVQCLRLVHRGMPGTCTCTVGRTRRRRRSIPTCTELAAYVGSTARLVAASPSPAVLRVLLSPRRLPTVLPAFSLVPASSRLRMNTSSSPCFGHHDHRS